MTPFKDGSFAYFRAWESLSDVTCCKSLVIVYDKRVILQIGFAAASSDADEAVVIDADKLMEGSLYQGVLKSKSRKRDAFTHSLFCESFKCLLKMQISTLFAESYLANLSLYPAKSELPFLPLNTQVLVIFFSLHDYNFELYILQLRSLI